MGVPPPFETTPVAEFGPLEERATSIEPGVTLLLFHGNVLPPSPAPLMKKVPVPCAASSAEMPSVEPFGRGIAVVPRLVWMFSAPVPRVKGSPVLELVLAGSNAS